MILPCVYAATELVGWFQMTAGWITRSLSTILLRYCPLFCSSVVQFHTGTAKYFTHVLSILHDIGIIHYCFRVLSTIALRYCPLLHSGIPYHFTWVLPTSSFRYCRIVYNYTKVLSPLCFSCSRFSSSLPSSLSRQRPERLSQRSTSWSMNSCFPVAALPTFS